MADSRALSDTKDFIRNRARAPMTEHSRSSSGAPSYTSSQSDDYVRVGRESMEKNDKSRAFGKRAEREPTEYLPPPFPPPGRDQCIEEHRSVWQRHRKAIATTTYISILCLVAFFLAIPVMMYHEDAYGSDWDDDEQHNTIYYIFLFLLTGWVSGSLANLFANILPHLFRMVAKYVNQGHRKYWRIFRFLRAPITTLGLTFGLFLGWTRLITNNDRLIIQRNKKPGAFQLENVIDDLFIVGVVWACLYMLEKIFILFLAIHYHYQSDSLLVEKNKHMRKAVVKLYEISIYLNPPFHDPFRAEDAAIREFIGSGSDSRDGAGKFLQKLGVASSNLMDGLGKMLNHNDKSRWFRSATTQAIVDRALEHPRASAALAKRIWMSLVPEGHEILTCQDLVDVIGPARKDEAEEWFKTLDENENGDLTLNELVLIVLDIGRTRNAVYQGMSDINRAINTLDWIFLVLIAMTIFLFTLTSYVPALKRMKDAAGLTALGLSFGLGRTIYEFLNGCVFILFKHAYDIGDRIEIYNTPATIKSDVIVKRISVLFTVFQRLDNGKDMQISNDRLNQLNICNVTRSAANREEISIFVDFNTTFTDIQYLKGELSYFLALRENSRDYRPGLELRIASIHEMNKLEMKCSFTHKSNWSNEELRAARSSKFMCALVAAIRKLALPRPGALVAGGSLQEAKDREFNHETEAAAYSTLTLIPAAAGAHDPKKRDAATGAEIYSWIGADSTGLRRRPEGLAGGVFYG